MTSDFPLIIVKNAELVLNRIQAKLPLFKASSYPPVEVHCHSVDSVAINLGKMKDQTIPPFERVAPATEQSTFPGDMQGPFKEGQIYSRDTISAVLGGDGTSYLPSKNMKTVCACIQPELNPDAPRIILPGCGPKIEQQAIILKHTKGPIPCFLKRMTGAWEYVGEWECESVSRNPDVIAAEALKAHRRDISMVITMRKKTDADGAPTR